MLRELQGRSHDVATAFALADPRTSQVLAEKTVRTTVAFRAASSAEIDEIVSTGDGRDKAGAYALQGMASSLIVRIDGSHTNVIGLPTADLVMELQRLDLL
jgi:septum formation protein